MPKFYFTFGSNHLTAEGMSLGQCFVPIEADSYGEAREKMVEARGPVWAFQYDEEDFAGQVERFGLIRRTLAEVWIPKEKSDE